MYGILVYMLWVIGIYEIGENHGIGMVLYMYALLDIGMAL
jgi:hypothetical protein